MRQVGLIALLAVTCATGCYPPSSPPVYVPINERPHTLYVKRPDQVEIYMAGKPDRPFVEIGMIEVQEDWQSPNSRDVVTKMREFAGQRGCDALAIFSGNDSMYDPGGKASATAVHGYRGSCIVYTTKQPVAAATGAVSVPGEVTPPPSAAGLSCIPNSTQQCWGPGACRGGQSCTAEGNAYTVCDCRGAGTQAQSTPKK